MDCKNLKLKSLVFHHDFILPKENDKIIAARELKMNSETDRLEINNESGAFLPPVKSMEWVKVYLESVKVNDVDFFDTNGNPIQI